MWRTNAKMDLRIYRFRPSGKDRPDGVLWCAK